MEPVKTLQIRAAVQSAFSKDLGASVFSHSIHKFVVTHPGGETKFQLNRFMVNAPEVFFRPVDRFVFETATNSIIDTDMVRQKTDPRVTGFGEFGDLGSDGRRVVNFQDNGFDVKGPVLCIGPWGRAFSNQILHILMGITHCDDILGERLPILVPDDLTVRETANLSFAGVGPERMLRVPRNSACRVTDAFIPSKSFIRDSTFGPRVWKVNYGFIFEPSDLLAYVRRIRFHPAIAASIKPKGGRILYISRKDANGRFITNEDEAVRALSRFDLRYLLPTKVPIEEIGRAVATADIVISAFGSAILHFFAARPGTTLIEFDHLANDQCGRAICRVTNCKHVICTRVVGRPRNFGDMSDNPVNVEELVQLVKEELDVRDASPVPKS